jgi:amidase
MALELPFRSAIELAHLIQTREVSSVELTRMYIDRIERYDGAINAVPVRVFEKALADAAEADATLARGEDVGPLHGVPMTIKESYVLEDTPATWGLEAFRDNVAARDGLAVSRFRDAGAVFVGKTNVPVDLADFQSYNPIYGTTGNPWNTDLIPGGSSGGSSAALAAGFSALEAGSDIGGSIRNPAHYCGVYGHKPTWGIVPMSGHELMEGVPDADLSVCGPLARSAADLALALGIMAGPMERDAVGWKLDLPGPDIASLKSLRVAIWANDDQAPVSRETEARVVMVGETLAKLGATVSDTARPDFDPRKAHINYRSLLESVMGSAKPMAYFEEALARAAQLDPEDMSDEAVTLRGAVMHHRDWIRHNFRRERLRRAWDEFFAEWDILICPQMATPAFPHDHRPFAERTISVDGVDQPYWQQLFWAGMASNAYLPSTVFPTGPGSDGLPIGLQAISAPYRDYRTIEFASLIAEEIGGFVPPPGLTG